MRSIHSKKKLLHGSLLCVIVHRDFFASTRSLVKAVEQIARSGAAFVQLRDKGGDTRRMLEEALAVKACLARRRVLLVINDRADIARLIDADGVHLGQHDLPIAHARRLLGRDSIIGISCANLTQALQAQKAGADYLGIGPVFTTATKTDEPAVGTAMLADIARHIRIPWYAIGGINRLTIQHVLESGARRVAISSAICRATDRQRAARTFIRILRRS